MVAYNGSQNYGVARLGAEFPLQKNLSERMVKDDSIKNLRRELMVISNFSWYHHPGFNDNLTATTGLRLKRTNQRGFFTAFSAETGYSRTLLSGKVYTADGNGIVTTDKLAGYNYALLSAGASAGIDFSKNKPIPVMIFTELNLITLFPYNNSVYIWPALDIGLIFKL